MITSRAFAGKRYAVLGLARSGAATVRALAASDAKVVAWDSDAAKREALAELAPMKDPLEINLKGFDGVVVSPGVPLNTHPIAKKAADAGVPVIGDVELFAQARPDLPAHKVVGITGTNGKSTTTALIHHMLATAGYPTTLGGNIGLPILGQDPLAPNAKGEGVYVLELSSFQIDLTRTLDCDVAVLTNITPDHLDRYASFADYARSKARLFFMQTQDGTAVIATDDEPTRRIAKALREGIRPAQTSQAAVTAAAGMPGGAVLGSAGNPEVVEASSAALLQYQHNWPTLQGPHNAQNVACAVVTARALGLSDDEIRTGVRSYPGLPHRMERVAEKRGVLYVNDSKATNATATAPALGAYKAIHWILGGIAKTDDLDACAPYYDHVLAGYTIGQAGPMFAGLLRAAGKPVTESGTLDRAVRDAAAAAKPGEVVMLSPACASFDQFSDYEARGRAFREAVEELA
ncbi:MAG: UDP-N-acetylmuramoyl-L-alanine--D-glutamate ligase [Sphingomonadaceae bacterium]|nr:UDP-N-acetylmuramoyl-L-alanine--D-glutamate ligase [Sphingomonadaceae bacterium]